MFNQDERQAGRKIRHGELRRVGLEKARDENANVSPKSGSGRRKRGPISIRTNREPGQKRRRVGRSADIHRDSNKSPSPPPVHRHSDNDDKGDDGDDDDGKHRNSRSPLPSPPRIPSPSPPSPPPSPPLGGDDGGRDEGDGGDRIVEGDGDGERVRGGFGEDEEKRSENGEDGAPDFVPVSMLEGNWPSPSPDDAHCWLRQKKEDPNRLHSNEVFKRMCDLLAEYDFTNERELSDRVKRYYDSEFKEFDDSNRELTLRSVQSYLRDTATPNVMLLSMARLAWKRLLLYASEMGNVMDVTDNRRVLPNTKADAPMLKWFKETRECLKVWQKFSWKKKELEKKKKNFVFVHQRKKKIFAFFFSFLSTKKK
jgi:hypothetical protein